MDGTKRERKEMTVITAVTRDDSRFDAVRNEQWFVDLPNDIFDELSRISFELVGYSYCHGCNDFGILYKSLYNGNDYISSECKTHVRANMLSHIVGYNWKVTYGIDDVHVDTLIPPLDIPTDHLVIPEREECEVCNGGMFTLAMSAFTERTWYTTALVPREAKGSSGDILIAHKQCTFICTHCSVTYANKGEEKTGHYDVNNKTVCQSCWDELSEENTYVDCDSCSTYISEDDDTLYYSDYRDQNLCESCSDSPIECGDCGEDWYETEGHTCEDDEDNSAYIHSYGYKPRPNFFGSAPYYLGLELEVESKRASVYDGAEYVYEKVGDRAYLKYDGSLSDGFEIVTHPHSLEEMQSKFPWKILPWLQDEGFRSWNTSSCGIHVHVSRAAFKDDAHQIKFTKLIYDNQRQVERLAGRKSSYAKFNDKGKVVRKVKFGNQSDGRYSAVNNENDNTLEVRVFRGSLRKERVLSALEFTHAAVEYTKTLKMVAKDKPLSWARFIAFIVLNHQTYPNLLTIVGELFDKENEVIDQEEVNN